MFSRFYHIYYHLKFLVDFMKSLISFKILESLDFKTSKTKNTFNPK